jgi:hypothetical protein
MTIIRVPHQHFQVSALPWEDLHFNDFIILYTYTPFTIGHTYTLPPSGKIVRLSVLEQYFQETIKVSGNF